MTNRNAKNTGTWNTIFQSLRNYLNKVTWDFLENTEEVTFSRLSLTHQKKKKKKKKNLTRESRKYFHPSRKKRALKNVVKWLIIRIAKNQCGTSFATRRNLGTTFLVAGLVDCLNTSKISLVGIVLHIFSHFFLAF